SEAAALFIGGAWLSAVTESIPLQKDARRWQDTGRRWLENRLTTLVAEDGSFSQYSVNYHRVLVDTLCQVELWRTELKERPFSDRYIARCHAAVEWLATMTDTASGNAPNLGANDGARLYDLSSAPYRDFRPSVQLSSVLLRGGRTYEKGAWDEPLLWLGVGSSVNPVPQSDSSVIHKDGGDIILRGKDSWGMVRFAHFRFRPSHADCLHLDLWHNGENILRDGGTFSYNTEPRWLDYFSGTESHNTVQFDERNQMPRIGRFLFGKWLKMAECSDIRRKGASLFWTGAYTDWKHAPHRRSVSVNGNVWRVIDEVSGFRDKAVLRWRLIPEEWSLADNTCVSQRARLRISSTAPLRRLELTTGWESLYYQQKTELPVLEIEVAPGRWTIETEITLKD
ncbi:MAG: heparinase II/III-family protein, partial [Pedobacter sp.]